MEETPDPKIEAIVAKFFAARRQGQRRSIDEVLDAFPELQRHPEIRASALKSIALRSRISRAGGEAPRAPSGGSSGHGSLYEEPLPELDGYDLIDRVGRGGMGVVYEAYQQSTGRRVAVKFMLDSARVTESARRRFEREVELVARLDHPGIVSVLDSGVHRGRYFYVMEFVNGRPLDEALPPGASDRRKVVEVAAAICDVVDYAHQRGVLHRDLKPSNILMDIRGQPRLLDFGLAKAIDPPSEVGGGTFRQTLSEPGQLIGTLAYMSPEQSLGELGQVSVRSDVYSLGAILYELLTGKLPCPVDGPPRDVLDGIVNKDPPPPSSVLRARMPDLDAVVLRALEKSPNARYASAGEFAADLRRTLADEPVTARRVGPAVKTARWVRRNRRVSIVGAGAIVAIIAVTTAAFVSISGERDRAQAIKGYLEKMFTAFDPDLATGDEIRARRKILEDSWKTIEADVPRQLDVEASVRMIVGNAFRQLGEYGRAREHHERVVAIDRGRYANPSRELSVSTFELARDNYWLGFYEVARLLYEESHAMRAALFGPESKEAVDAINALAACWRGQGDLKRAEQLYRDALRIRRLRADAIVALSADQTPQQTSAQADLAAAMNNLGRVLLERGELVEAGRLIRGSVDLIQRLPGQQWRGESAALINLGRLLIVEGRVEDGVHALSRALSIRRVHLASDHPQLADVLCELARALKDLHRMDEARAACAEAIRIYQVHGDSMLTERLEAEKLAHELGGSVQPPAALQNRDAP